MASRTSRWRISTGHVGSSGDQSTKPEVIAGPIAALGEPTCVTLAQLDDGHAEIQHRQHLHNDPGLGWQHPQVLTHGGGQGPGQPQPPSGQRIEIEPLAQHRVQIQRVPPGAPVQPLDGLIVQRPGPERTASDATSSGLSPLSGSRSRFSTLASIRRAASSSRSTGPR
jgi:hypothetical protein